MNKYKGKTIGLIGTNEAINTKIYNLTKEVVWLIPDGEQFKNVHNSYVALAIEGKADKKNSATLISASRALINRGSEVIVLGGTDLYLVFQNQKLPF